MGLFRRTSQPSLAKNNDITPTLPEVPNFERLDNHDPAAVSRALLQGPSLPVMVGPSRTLFTVPFRMMLYNAGKLRSCITLDRKKNEYELLLPDEEPLAFSHLCQWMHTNQIDLNLVHQGVNLPQQFLREKSNLLCDMYLTATFFGINAVEPLILEKLEGVFDLASVSKFKTPLAPETILRVRDILPKDDEEIGKSELWKTLMTGMARAFVSNIRPNFDEYWTCFEVTAFKKGVVVGMADKVIAIKRTIAEESDTSSLTWL